MANLNQSMNPVSAKLPVVADRIQFLNDAVQNLQSAADNVMAKCHPVLSAEITSPGCEKVMAPNESTVPIARALDEIISRIEATQSVLVSILNRLEI